MAESNEDARHELAENAARAMRLEGVLASARRLGLQPSTLRSRIRKLGIVREDG